MPKPILRTYERQQTSDILSISPKTAGQPSVSQEDKLKLDRLLRRKRSPQYMDAMKKLDAGGHVHNQNAVNEIIHTIKNEFPDVDISSILLGCVAVCRLGAPYEVHTLDLEGGIIEHYKSGQILPNGMEKARGIAMNGGYAFIEVYIDCCRAIGNNGDVSVIAC